MSNPSEDNNKTSYPLHGGIPQGFQAPPTSMEVTQKLAAYEAELNQLRSNLYDCQRDIAQRDIKIEALERELKDLMELFRLALSTPNAVSYTTAAKPY